MIGRGWIYDRGRCFFDPSLWPPLFLWLIRQTFLCSCPDFYFLALFCFRIFVHLYRFGIAFRKELILAATISSWASKQTAQALKRKGIKSRRTPLPPSLCFFHQRLMILTWCVMVLPWRSTAHAYHPLKAPTWLSCISSIVRDSSLRYKPPWRVPPDPPDSPTDFDNLSPRSSLSPSPPPPPLAMVPEGDWLCRPCSDSTGNHSPPDSSSLDSVLVSFDSSSACVCGCGTLSDSASLDSLCSRGPVSTLCAHYPEAGPAWDSPSWAGTLFDASSLDLLCSRGPVSTLCARCCPEDASTWDSSASTVPHFYRGSSFFSAFCVKTPTVLPYDQRPMAGLSCSFSLDCTVTSLLGINRSMPHPFCPLLISLLLLILALVAASLHIAATSWITLPLTVYQCPASLQRQPSVATGPSIGR